MAKQKTTLEYLLHLIDNFDDMSIAKIPHVLADLRSYCEIAIIENEELRDDLHRACAVINDTFGAGTPAVNETEETLADWAEEFSDRYAPPVPRPELKVVRS